MNGLKRKEKLESQTLYVKICLETGDYLYYLFAIRMFVDVINTLIIIDSRGWLVLLILLLNTIHFMDHQIVNNVNDSDNVVRKKCANKI